MTTTDFNARLKDLQAHTIDVLTAKAAEDATDDRLHNFKAAVALQRETPVKALGGMMVKHTVSVYDLIHDQKLAQISRLTSGPRRSRTASTIFVCYGRC